MAGAVAEPSKKDHGAAQARTQAASAERVMGCQEPGRRAARVFGAAGGAKRQHALGVALLREDTTQNARACSSRSESARAGSSVVRKRKRAACSTDYLLTVIRTATTED